jgi:hypothetical protein
MSESEQISAFMADMTRVMDRYRSEFQMTAAGMMGCLEFLKLDLYREISPPKEE